MIAVYRNPVLRCRQDDIIRYIITQSDNSRYEKALLRRAARLNIEGAALSMPCEPKVPMPAPSAIHVVPITLILLLAACGDKPANTAAPPIEVGFVTLASGAVTISTELTGRAAATMTSDVRPQVAGMIKARLFTEGATVKAGQPLYQIDPALFEAARDQAAATLENARATLTTDQAKANRYKRLADMDAVSGQDIDDALAAAAQALAMVHADEAALKTAEVNLGYTRILAPISGRIGRSSVTPGALVTGSQTTALATVQQLDPIYVDIAQSSQQLLRLRQDLAHGSVLAPSAAVQLKLEDGTEYPHAGTLEFAEVTVDANAGTVTLRASFPNPEGLLLPGMFLRVATPQSVVPNAIMAPQQGITRNAKGDAVALVLDADDKVEQRTVVTGDAVGDKWLVTAGLKAGDRLIVEGTNKVKAGMVVKPVAITTRQAG
jgi:membrane fusion protein (multidrug efflux system)